MFAVRHGRVEADLMMNSLDSNLFFVRERPGMLRLVNDFDVIDPATGQPVMHCREEPPRGVHRLLRYSALLRRTTPFDIRVQMPEGGQVLRMKRGVPVIASEIQVFDGAGVLIGLFRQKPISMSGAFDVLDAARQPVCRLVGARAGWNFRFMAPGDIEVGRVTKKWGGLGKELFSSASDYVLQIDEVVPADSLIRRLIFASALCVGVVQKIDIP